MSLRMHVPAHQHVHMFLGHEQDVRLAIFVNGDTMTAGPTSASELPATPGVDLQPFVNQSDVKFWPASSLAKYAPRLGDSLLTSGSLCWLVEHDGMQITFPSLPRQAATD